MSAVPGGADDSRRNVRGLAWIPFPKRRSLNAARRSPRTEVEQFCRAGIYFTMKLPIYLYGSKVLREPAQAADVADREKISALVSDMEETLASADGCGLAAPQVGVPTRVLIVDGRGLEDVYPYLKDFKRVMINPVVVEESKETCDYSEGCLSVPGIYAEVRRPEKIKVEYINADFEPVAEEFDKFACRMVQHELDHLDGKMFVDRVAPIRRKMIAKKLSNISRGKVSAHYKTKHD